jgi:dipeptidyl aminopeptidase/acylaminoacyl peptidase
MNTMSRLTTTILSLVGAVAVAQVVGCHPGGPAGGTRGTQDDLATPVRHIPIEDFFRNPEQTDFELSPDGSHYAWVSPHEGVLNLFVREIGSPGLGSGGSATAFDDSAGIQLTDSTERDIYRFFWGNDRYILYLQDTAGDENYRLYRVDIATKTTDCLTDFQGVDTNVISALRNHPDEIIISMNRRSPDAFDPYSLNLSTGELEPLAENPGDVTSWICDNEGTIRIAEARGLLYRSSPDAEFREILPLEKGDTFLPRYFAPDNRTVYAYSSIGRDKIAIVEFDLEKGEEVRVLFEHPVYDAFGDDERDHFDYSFARQRLSYALYTAEKRELEFFDKELEQLYHKLRSRIGDYELQFASVTDDLGRMIVEASSDRQPGIVYLYDAGSDTLEKLQEISPWLDEDELAEMRPIRYEARDGLTIHGYLTLPRGITAENLPVIVHPHAGPQWRNSWGFDAGTQFFANRGYAVLQVNFRGSEGYGKSFLEAGFKQWGLKMQDDITDGVHWLIDERIADPERIAIFGWSYGGYAALAGLTFTPEIYACGLDLWGISNYFTLYRSFPSYWKPFLEQVNERWGDIEKDREQMYRTSPVFHVQNIRAPLFIAQGENDARVGKEQAEELIAELEKHGKEFEFYLIKGEGHAFSNESKHIELMTAIEAFLERHMGGTLPMNASLSSTGL